MNAKKALIVVNGDLFDFKQVHKFRKEGYDFIIACDGASTHLIKLNVVPDVIIGDFDSSPFPAIRVGTTATYIKYPMDKDYTDSELALDYAKHMGCKDVVIVGLNGTRTDHLLANIFLIAKAKYRKLKIEYRDHDQIIYIAKNSITIAGDQGDTISFLPLFGPIKIKSCNGLKYDLTKYDISMYGNQGISNVLSKNNATVNILRGKLLVIHQTNGSNN